jgi:hypothetical protein
MKSTFLRTFTISALILASVASLSSCTSSSPAVTPAATTTTSIPTGTKLTTAQATKLSRLLFVNRDLGGADVIIAVPFGLESSITIVGEVDWKTHEGRGEIKVIKNDGTLVDTSQIWWGSPQNLQQGFVVTSLKGLTEAMDKTGRKGVKYVARPLSEKSPVDIILRYLDALSADQPENPLLLRQDPKTGYIGRDTIDVAAAKLETDVIRFGRSRYWVDLKTGQMAQASAPLAGLKTNTQFTLAAHGPKKISFPLKEEVVNVDEIPEIYQQLTSRPK